MLPIAELVATLEDNEATAEQIITARKALLKYEIFTNEEIENFNNRFKKCKRLENEFIKHLYSLNRRYTRLKKAFYQFKLAKDKDYCYSLK